MEPATFDDADDLMCADRGHWGAALAALHLMAEEEEVGLYLGFAERTRRGGFGLRRVIAGTIRKR